jgi:methylmalonyl-CoA mutase
MAELAFASLFPPADEARWRAAVDKALKGGDFGKKLVSRAADGFAIQPLYPRREKAEAVLRDGAGQRWAVHQRIDVPDPDAAHRQALADLEGGATGLTLVLAGAPSARGFGVQITDLADLDTLLEGVFIELISLRFETAPYAGWSLAQMLPELAARRKLQPGQLDVDLGLDPVGEFASSGAAPKPMAEIIANMAAIAGDLRKAGIGGRFMRADARIIHEAGGSEGQELGFALAASVSYLRALEAQGVALEAARDMLSFTLAIDPDQFMGLAKLRALRKLFARIEVTCGLTPSPTRIHAETAWRMQTRFDAPVNMLRNAIAVFSAGVGGADSVSVLPHSLAQGLPDDFARRVARNMQHVLLEESNLWRVADPSAGAGGIEALTDELCAAGWAFFQEIERAGGVVSALEGGFIRDRIAGIRDARGKALATRRAPITGTSEFPNLNEPKPDVVEGAPPASMPAPGPVALPSLRLSEGYEALRDRSDAMLAAGGARPRVFLANLGRIADFTARATFARALFEAGGVQAVTNDGFWETVIPDRAQRGAGIHGTTEDVPDMDPRSGLRPVGDDKGATDLVALTDAFKASGAGLACICSSDALYPHEAADAAMALMASGARKIWLAGRPGDLEAQLAAAGVSGYVFAGCDVLSTLKEALDVTGA